MEIAENRYVAASMIYNETGWNAGGKPLVAVYGDPDEAEGEGRTLVVGSDELDLADSANQHLMIEVYDYAANHTTYKVNFNPAELEQGVTELVITPEEASVVPGGKVSFSVEAKPWGIDDSVTWTTGDSAIATVDANGVVTGVEEGVTTVTATSTVNPDVSATAKLTVFYVDETLNAVVWDEDGKVWMSEFNTKDITKGNHPQYTKLMDAPYGADIVTVSYDLNGEILYAADMTDDFLSTLYTVDPRTFELTEIGSSSEVAYLDLAPSYLFPILSNNPNATMMAAYGPYLLAIDVTTGEYAGYLDLTDHIEGDFIVGLAYDGMDEGYGSDDYIFVVDNLGKLYIIDLWYYPGSGLYVFDNPIGQIGEGVEYDHYNDLYSNGEYLFWTRFNNSDENVVSLISVSLEDGSIMNLGDFDEGVWPVSGMFELGNAPYASNGNREILTPAEKQAYAESHPSVSLMTGKIEKLHGSAVKGGSLNAVASDAVSRDAIIPDTGRFSATVTVTADELTTNGLYTVEYDDTLELVSVTSNVSLRSVNTSVPGEVTFAFATLNAVPKDGAIFTLKFNVLDEETESMVKVVNVETNDELGLVHALLLKRLPQPRGVASGADSDCVMRAG